MSVQDFQDELIQDVLVATSTLGNLYGEKREGEGMSSSQPGPEMGTSQAATFSLLGRSCTKNISPK